MLASLSYFLVHVLLLKRGDDCDVSTQGFAMFVVMDEDVRWFLSNGSVLVMRKKVFHFLLAAKATLHCEIVHNVANLVMS